MIIDSEESTAEDKGAQSIDDILLTQGEEFMEENNSLLVRRGRFSSKMIYVKPIMMAASEIQSDSKD